MMLSITLGNKTGTVVYLDDDWHPTEPDAASLAKVLFDDGSVSFYRVSPSSLRAFEFNPEQARDDHGRWTSGKTMSDADHAWFKGSKVVDPSGHPREVFHGTNAQFNQFDARRTPGKIIWFTSDKESITKGESGAAGSSRILGLYASIKNPAGWEEYNKYGLGQLVSMGFDGVLLDKGNGHFDGFVFDKKNLRSSTGKKSFRGLEFYTDDDYTEPRTAARQPDTFIHEIADAHAPTIEASVAYAFAKGRASVSRPRLKAAGSRAAALREMTHVPGIVSTALHRVLYRPWLDCLKAGGEAGVLSLQPRTAEWRAGKRKPALGMKFDATSPEVIKWAREHVAETIDDLSKTTKKDIREAVTSAFEGDLSVGEMVDSVMEAVGSETRGKLIARTESMTAANAGLFESWAQAVKEGLLAPTTQKVWIATESGACDICDNLNGQVVNFDEVFSNGKRMPPDHPRCRCTSGLV